MSKKKEEKKEGEGLAGKLGIDTDHFNGIARKIFEKVATGELNDKLEMIKMAKEFTEAERNFLITIGLETMVETMLGFQIVTPPKE